MFNVASILFLSLFSFSQNSDLKNKFKDFDGCFRMVQISDGKVIGETRPKICDQRFSPNSTFKIPLALMGFEKGILKSEDQVIKWDGKKRDRPEVNQDQTPATWIERSVVWVSQWLTPQLTEPTIQKFLKDFSYGNQDFSGGITQAWLDSSLKISPNEQINFISNFWKESLPLSKNTFEKVKKISFIKRLDSKADLYGKTGTGCLNKGCSIQQGWFVGILKTEKEAYAFAAFTQDKKKISGYAGPRVRQLITDALNTWEAK